MEKAGVIVMDGKICCQRKASDSYKLYHNTTQHNTAAFEHNGKDLKKMFSDNAHDFTIDIIHF